jgi:hypothetical protein
MKKVFLALAAAAMIFAGCSKDEDNTIDNLADKIIGKWISTDVDGHAELTNNKSVITILSTTQAIISTSRSNLSGGQGWVSHLNASVVMDGNKVTITGQPNEHITIVYEITVRSITATNMEGTFKHNTLRDGEVITANGPMEMRWVKVTADYQQAVLGKWEGHVTSEQGSEFDDGEDHQWEYLDDGTFRYYLLDQDSNWVTNPHQTLSEYFVDGTLLCTRWVIDGTENREWWEIESIEGGVMRWKALRQREDGSTYTATFQMNKIPQNSGR